MNLQLVEPFFDTPILCEPARLKTRLDLLLAGKAFAHPMDDAGRPWSISRAVGDIAVIDVSGVLVNRAVSAFDVEFLGLASTRVIKAELLRALESPDVKAVLLSIDSPGGMGFGVQELARVVADASKPIIAYSNALMASAAYEIASQADEIMVTPDAYVGSIGVVITHIDQSEMEKQLGVTVTQIHAGAAKIDFSGHKALDKGALARIQGLVDSLYGQFVETVARGRGLTEDAVRATEAAIYTGQQAVGIGLVDTIVQSGTPFSEALARASALAGDRGIRQEETMAEDRATASQATEARPAIPDELDAVRMAFPRAFAAIRQAGVDEGEVAGVKTGAETERARLVQIDEHAMGVPAELVAKIKQDGTPFVDAALVMLRAVQSAQKAAFEATATAAEASPPAADAATGEAVVNLDQNASEEQIKAFWTAHPTLAEEFPSGIECFTALVADEGFSL